MQRDLFLYLCVLGAFVFVETRPRCRNYNNCNNGGSQYGYTQEQYSSQYGYNGQSEYEVDSVNNGSGESEYSSGGGGNSNGRYGAHGSHGRHGSGRFDISAFIPRNCPNCRINNLGNGNGNTHTFNIPE